MDPQILVMMTINQKKTPYYINRNKGLIIRNINSDKFEKEIQIFLGNNQERKIANFSENFKTKIDISNRQQIILKEDYQFEIFSIPIKIGKKTVTETGSKIELLILDKITFQPKIKIGFYSTEGLDRILIRKKFYDSLAPEYRLSDVEDHPYLFFDINNNEFILIPSQDKNRNFLILPENISNNSETFNESELDTLNSLSCEKGDIVYFRGGILEFK